jgi:hypothetical protein
MGRYLERTVPGAVATYYPDEGHHFVYDRWREILSVIVAEARLRAGARSGLAAGAHANAGHAPDGRGVTGLRERETARGDLRGLSDSAASA